MFKFSKQIKLNSLLNKKKSLNFSKETNLSIFDRNFLPIAFSQIKFNFTFVQRNCVSIFEHRQNLNLIKNKYLSTQKSKMDALLLGVYEKKENDTKTISFTKFGQSINHNLNNKLLNQLNIAGPLKLGKSRVLYNIDPQYPIIVVVGLGPEDASFNPIEDLNESNENVRVAIGSGINTIRDLDVVKHIQVDGCSKPLAASEAAHLASYVFDLYKQKDLKSRSFTIDLADKTENNLKEWKRGEILAYYQNKCKELTEKPANLLNPTIFSEEAKEICEPLGVKVIVHDEQWAKEKKMGAFLSVAQGSNQPPKFVELHYKNTSDNQKPLVFVGKGITFDSGGISLKNPSNMDLMRGDMSGAANVLCSIAALAKLKAKVNIVGLIPLTENLISGKATKPGDVVFASNGKSIQVNNTDAEGRLILSDALVYSENFDPFLVVDIATLTGAVIAALGSACTAVYSTNKNYWKLIRDTGYETGDRVWRMPLYNIYLKKTKDSVLADLVNVSKEPSYGGGSAIAALFLKEFVTCSNWMHIDMAGSMSNSGDYNYISKGMSGRPLRTLVNFFENVFEKN